MKCCERWILQTQMRQIVRRSKTEVLRRVLVFERPVIPGGRGGGGRRAGLSHVPGQKTLCFKGKRCSQSFQIQTYVTVLKQKIPT